MSTSVGTTQRGTPRFGRIDAALESVEAAIRRSRDYIFSTQSSEGYWCGELEADSMLEADYIFVHRFLGTGDEGKMQRALTEMLRFQNEDGSWSIYPGGPGNISLTVKCYFACKLMGWSQDEPILVKAREWILAHGGVVRCNTFTKIYLCALGQYEYDAVPAVPRRSCSFRSGFTSISTKFLRGRARSSFRFRLRTPKSRSRRFRRSRELMSFSSADAKTPICTSAGTVSTGSAGATSFSCGTVLPTGLSVFTSVRCALLR